MAGTYGSAGVTYGQAGGTYGDWGGASPGVEAPAGESWGSGSHVQIGVPHRHFEAEAHSHGTVTASAAIIAVVYEAKSSGSVRGSYAPLVSAAVSSRHRCRTRHDLTGARTAASRNAVHQLNTASMVQPLSMARARDDELALLLLLEVSR